MIRVKQLIKSCSLFVVTLLMLSACDSVELNNVPLQQNSIVYCAEGSPDSFNPQTVTSGTTIDVTAKHLYNRLIALDAKDNTVIPSLAKSWHVTNDRKKITFYLEKNVSFHDTDYFSPSRPLNADDVLFSFNRVLNNNHRFYPVSGGRYPFFHNIGMSELVSSIEKVDDYTVRFTLTRPDSSFLANLATDFAVILSKEYAIQLAKQGRHSMLDILPIGTGPYKFKEYRPGSMIRYYAHNNYWQGKPALSQLIIDITPNNSSRLTKLLTKECDVIAYPIAHEKIAEKKELILEQVTAFNVGYLGFNTSKPPFDNIKLRQAISHAINKQAIIDTVYFGHAEIATSIIPSNSWAYNAEIRGHNYSIETARKMLIDAGYAEGFTMDIWALPIQRAYNPNALTMAKLIQADLKNIGITVNIVSYEWSTFLRKLSEGEHQSVLIGWSADHADPDNFFNPLLSCNAKESGSNFTFWCDEGFDTILNSALQSQSRTTRYNYYAQAIDIIHQQVPLIPIAHSKRYQARTNRVKGPILHSVGGIDFSKVSKK